MFGRSMRVAWGVGLTTLWLVGCGGASGNDTGADSVFAEDVAQNDAPAPLDVVGDRDSAAADSSALDVLSDTEAEPETSNTDTSPDVPLEAICTAGTRWTPGQALFVERTDDWGLTATGAAGQRVSVIDFDGDGWDDILVRRAGADHDDHNPGGQRMAWLLRNVEGTGFEDVTESSGLLLNRLDQPEGFGRTGQVYAAADVDNDGDLDLYCGAETADPTKTLGETSELLLNDGHGHFTLGPETSALRRADDVDMVAGASFVDYDLDGKVDLWVTENGYATSSGANVILQDRLYRGDGAGSFSDVTDESGLTTVDWVRLDALNNGEARSRAWSAAACDLNGDGVTELLAASYGRAPNHAWQGVWRDGAVTFWNRSVACGYAYDENFTWQDNEFARCFCQSNRDAEDCADVPAPNITCSQPNWDHTYGREPFRLGGNSGATRCADIDNDGDIELLTTEIRHWWAGSGADGSELLINDGAFNFVFDRPGDEALGLAVEQPPYNWDEGHMSATIFDFDNDGWLDIYIGASDYAGNRGLLYHNEAGERGELGFIEVSTEDFFEHNRSHGVGIADFDHDGDLDVVVGHSRARCDASAPNDCYPTMQVRVFENVFGDAGNWIQLDLEGGEGTNRAAIGARVTVIADGVTQTREVGGGYGHYGAQDSRVVSVGLGAACEAQVRVRWPDASMSTESARLVAGYRYHWKQGERPIPQDR